MTKISPSKRSPHGDTLRPYADYPHLLGTDPRRGTLFGGFGEIGVWRILFIDEDDTAPFGAGQSVDDGTVLCAVDTIKASKVAPHLLVPSALQSQGNLVLEVAVGGELGDLFVRMLSKLGLHVIQSSPDTIAPPPPNMRFTPSHQNESNH